jgi:hypothetical protein
LFEFSAFSIHEKYRTELQNFCPLYRDYGSQQIRVSAVTMASGGQQHTTAESRYANFGKNPSGQQLFFLRTELPNRAKRPANGKPKEKKTHYFLVGCVLFVKRFVRLLQYEKRVCDTQRKRACYGARDIFGYHCLGDNRIYFVQAQENPPA